MNIQNLLYTISHRPYAIPTGPWSYYQEWNRAVFLHWRVDLKDLRPLVPEELEIDAFDGSAWISLVAFTMEKLRPVKLPAFSPLSDFHEINIRTYVKYRDKAGVYFMSIEGGKRLSCMLAEWLSELPYRYSKMERQEEHYRSTNAGREDRFALGYQPGQPIINKSGLDKWLTERYALFQDTDTSINAFDIHHVEWPLAAIHIQTLQLDYPRFRKLLAGPPALQHYSSGVQVIAWEKKSYPKRTTPSQTAG